MNFELYNDKKNVDNYNYWNISKYEFELLKKHINNLEYFNFPTKLILDKILNNKFQKNDKKLLLNTEYEQDLKDVLNLFKKYSSINHKKMIVDFISFIKKCFDIQINSMFYIIDEKKVNFQKLKENQELFNIDKVQIFLEDEKNSYEKIKKIIIEECRKKSMKYILILTGDFLIDEKIILNILNKNTKINIPNDFTELLFDYDFEMTNYRYNKYLNFISSYNLKSNAIINLNSYEHNYYGVFPLFNKNIKDKKPLLIEKFNYKRNKYKLQTLLVNLDRRKDRFNKFINKYGDEYPNIFRFSAIDGKTFDFNPYKNLFDVSEYNKYKNIKNSYNHHCFKKGVLGCSMSHYTIWDMIYKNKELKDDDYVLVLEDDIQLVDNFNIKLNKLLEYLHYDNEWDVVFLGFTNYHQYQKLLKVCNGDEKKLEKMFPSEFPPGSLNYFKNLTDTRVNDMLIKFSGDLRLNGGGTFAYIIRKKGAIKYLEYARKYKIQQPIDWFMIELFDKMNVYKCEPEIVLSNIANNIKDADSDVQNLSEQFKFK